MEEGPKQVLETRSLGSFGHRIPRAWLRRGKPEGSGWMRFLDSTGFSYSEERWAQSPFSCPGPLFPKSNRGCLYEFLVCLSRLQLDTVTCNPRILTKASTFSLWTTVQFSHSFPKGPLVVPDRASFKNRNAYCVGQKQTSSFFHRFSLQCKLFWSITATFLSLFQAKTFTSN